MWPLKWGWLLQGDFKDILYTVHFVSQNTCGLQIQQMGAENCEVHYATHH